MFGEGMGRKRREGEGDVKGGGEEGTEGKEGRRGNGEGGRAREEGEGVSWIIAGNNIFADISWPIVAET